MILLLFAALLAQEKTIVEGTVVNALTGEPVRRAHVAFEGGKNRYGAESADDGKFRVEGLDPDDYQPQASRQGFLRADDEPWFALAPGEHIKDLVIQLTPQGVIAGYVVDEDGDPIPEAMVTAERSIVIDGRKVVLDSDSETTNKEGYFLIADLKAGRYRMFATPPARQPHAAEVNKSGTEKSFVRTEIPLQVSLPAGGARRDLEIRMKTSPVFRVRGRVVNPPASRLSVLLTSEAERGGQTSVNDGNFEFGGVAPGNYTLKVAPFLMDFANGVIGKATLFCNLPVTVSDRDVDGVTAELVPGATVEGKIRIEGEGHYDKPPTIRIETAMGSLQAEVKEDGTFSWANLSPEKHILDYGVPAGFYVKSVQYEHKPLSGQVVDLASSAGGLLEIILAPNGATVSAKVSDLKNVQVALWNETTIRMEDANANGVSNFEGLAPGEYRIAAWQKGQADEYLRLAEFRARFDSQKVTLTEGSHETVDVKPISKAASDAEIAKLQ